MISGDCAAAAGDSQLKRVVTAVANLFLVLALDWSISPLAASAQGETAYNLIDTVNSLRSSQGLEAYQVDAWLMTYAQEHAEYLDMLNYGTHEHSDGTLPWELGLQENVASGDADIVTVAVVVYQIWVDEGHLKTMTGYSSGVIGAGMATSADDGQIYYVIDVRPAAEAVPITPAPAATAGFVPLVTSTPRADGWIVHTVAEGQTLWSIAISYGTTVNAIRDLNGLPADSTVIYVGQELKILQATIVIPTTLSLDSTTIMQFPQPKGALPSATASPAPSTTPLPSQTPTSTPASILDRLSPNRVTGAVVLLSIGVIGLGLVIRFCFFGARQSRPLR
jgi:LysM repeat protein